MGNQSTDGTDQPLLKRIRMKLAWWVAPFATKTGVEMHLRLIEMDAREIQKCSVTPSQPDESAKGIERRVHRLQDELGLDSKYGTATDCEDGGRDE